MVNYKFMSYLENVEVTLWDSEVLSYDEKVKASNLIKCILDDCESEINYLLGCSPDLAYSHSYQADWNYDKLNKIISKVKVHEYKDDYMMLSQIDPLLDSVIIILAETQNDPRVQEYIENKYKYLTDQKYKIMLLEDYTNELPF